MNKLSVKFLLMLGLLGTVFLACDNDDDGIDILPPSINKPDDVTIAPGESVDLTFEITAPGGYQSILESDIETDVTDFGTLEVTDEPTVGDREGDVVLTFTAGAGAVDGTSGQVVLQIDDQQDQESGRDLVRVSIVGDAQTPEVGTISEVVADRDSLETLSDALVAAGLDDDLEGDGPFTLFAPSDSAFSALLEALELNDLDAVVTELTSDGVADLLRAHVVNESLMAADLEDGDYETLNDDQTLTISRDDDDNVLVNGAMVIVANIEASNGVIHIIDSVVNRPEGVAGNTVADVVADEESLSDLAGALEATGLDDALSGDGPFTIFAPDNDAFDALLEAIDLGDLDEVVAEFTDEGLADLLRAHVVNESLMADDLEEQDYQTLNEDQVLTITRDGEGNVLVNGAAVTTPNIEASNGVIHIIDSVVNRPIEFSLPATVVDTIATRDEDPNALNTLEDALREADLLNDLREDGPFTVFAPNNTAFADLLARLDEVNNLEELNTLLGEEGLSNVLKAHVVPNQELLAADIAAGDLETLNANAGITVTTNEEGAVFVNGAQVIETDLRTRNGVVHIIDSVINVPVRPLGTTVADIPELDSLEVALTLAELVETLNDEDQTYTVFAPDNEAFATLINNRDDVDDVAGLVAALQNDQEEGDEAATLLLNHVVADRITSDEITTGSTTVQTVGGATLTISLTDSGLTVNDIPINEVDIFATNGVIHIIDGVLLADEEDTGEEDNG